MIRTIYIYTLGALCIFLTSMRNNTYAQNKHLPNIIILLADDLGYGELGCQGNTEIPTPNIDAIAHNGVRFTNGYVTSSVCSPSRAGLLTGKYQHLFGYNTNLIGAENEQPGMGLPPEQITLSEHLLDAGYVSGIIGKWHQGATAPYHPHRQGFDEFFGFMHEGHYFLPPPYTGATTMLRRRILPRGGKGRWISADSSLIYSTHMGNNEPDYDANNPILRGSQPHTETSYLTDAFTREAVDFIDRHQDKPFFLYLAYNAVHSPLQAQDKYMQRFQHIKDIHRRIFAAMLANLDDSVGEVMKKLRDEGLEENTLVVFLSDNGGPTKELTSSNLPLRDGKGSLYEGGIRVPFMMQWKGTLPTGMVYEKAVISLDIFATAAALAQHPADNINGVNLIPWLTGESKGEPHAYLFWSWRNKAAIRQGNWKLVSSHPGWRGERVPWSLYRLDQDISESKDLVAQYPEKVAQLERIWSSFHKNEKP